MTKIYFLLFLFPLMISAQILSKYPNNQSPYIGGYEAYYKDLHDIIVEENLKPCTNKSEFYQFSVLVKTDSTISFIKDSNLDYFSKNKCAAELARTAAKYQSKWNPATVDGIKQPAVATFMIFPDDLFQNDKIQDDFLHAKSLAKNFRFRIKSIVPVTTQTHKIKTTFLIVDKKLVFIIDIKDDNKGDFIEAVGYATLHTGKSRTESYNFIFDTIWRQADLYESLREANKNLLYSYQKLEEHDAMEKEFINLAAHELRTPSQSIVGYSEMLKVLPERNKQYEEAISRNAERLYSLVTNMLSIARIESQTMKLNKTIFDLNIKIDYVIKDITQELELQRANKVGLEFKPIGKINITADKDKIFQVFANLLNNALKFTNQGSIIITAKQKEKTNQAVVMIKDSGPGIDPEIIPHLFTKFKAKSEKGLGLGLYISKNIIEAHHGKIEAYNNPNSNGATFVVTLPLKG